MDGPSEDAKFSNDFDVVYLGSSCSLLVIDRGNKAIREIQLNFDDCAYQYGSGFPLGKNMQHIITAASNISSCSVQIFIIFFFSGIVVLCCAGFFGYMLALLQRRISLIMSYNNVSHLLCTSYTPSPIPIILFLPHRVCS